jgi:hypothetical protein
MCLHYFYLSVDEKSEQLKLSLLESLCMVLESLRRVVTGLFVLRSWIEKIEIYLVFVVHGGPVIRLSYCPWALHISFSQRILDICMKVLHV